MKQQKTRDYLRFMESEIERLRSDGRFSTADNYHKALVRFRKWIGADAFDVCRLTPSLLETYSSHLLADGLLRNSVSFHMRILRAAYNKACRHAAADGLFSNVYTGVDAARKKAVPQDVIRRLRRLAVADPSLALSRDLFVFSYCARGMAFVDLAYLRRTSVRDGVIRYFRHKTGQPMYVKVEACMADVMAHYADPSSPYVFPVLSSAEPSEAYSEYKKALNMHNRNLKVLASMAGSSVSLSSYCARHSWATAARDRNVPISVISAGLGHTSERTTRMYISSLDNAVVDDANSLIVRGIL